MVASLTTTKKPLPPPQRVKPAWEEPPIHKEKEREIATFHVPLVWPWTIYNRCEHPEEHKALHFWFFRKDVQWVICDCCNWETAGLDYKEKGQSWQYPPGVKEDLEEALERREERSKETNDHDHV